MRKLTFLLFFLCPFLRAQDGKLCLPYFLGGYDTQAVEDWVSSGLTIELVVKALQMDRNGENFEFFKGSIGALNAVVNLLSHRTLIPSNLAIEGTGTLMLEGIASLQELPVHSQLPSHDNFFNSPYWPILKTDQWSKVFQVAHDKKIMMAQIHATFLRVAAEVSKELPPAVVASVALNGALLTFDPYARYVPRGSFFREFSKETSRIRRMEMPIQYVPSPRGYQIVEVNRSSLAYQNGIRPGDEIIAANGITFTSLVGSTEPIDVRPHQKNSVDLTIVSSSGRKWTTEVVDEDLEITIVEHRVYRIGALKVGRLIIHDFNSVSVGALAKEQTRFLIDVEKIDALIFDFRDNPGGSIDEGAAVASLVLPDGIPFCDLVESLTKLAQRKAISTVPSLHSQLPVSVLVNGRSISVPEAIAGVVQAYDRGYVIGEVTDGKGRFQTYVETRKREGFFSGLDLMEIRTAGQVRLPDGTTYQGRGIVPDFEIPSDEERPPNFKKYGYASEPFFPVHYSESKFTTLDALQKCVRANSSPASEIQDFGAIPFVHDVTMITALRLFECLKQVPGPHRGFRHP